MSRLQTLASFLMVLILLHSGGCAFGDRRATLSYQAGEIGKELAASPGSRGTIMLARFADQRSDRNAIGEVRNGYGMKTASVLATNDVCQWVTDALCSELEKAGYRVVEQPFGSPTISGDVLTVYCTALFAYEAEVSFYARVDRAGAQSINKRYTGKASGGLNWAATDSGYAWSLQLALRSAIGQFLSDLTGASPQKTV